MGISAFLLAQTCELAPVADVALEDVPCRRFAERRMHLAGMSQRALAERLLAVRIQERRFAMGLGLVGLAYGGSSAGFRVPSSGLLGPSPSGINGGTKLVNL
jgi:hypothetical protein